MLNIKMTGVTYNIYNDLIQLKVPGANVEKLTETGTVTPVTITVDQMADYESMFVAIADAQVVVDDLSKKMGAGSINMETASVSSCTPNPRLLSPTISFRRKWERRKVSWAITRGPCSSSPARWPIFPV